MQRTSDDLKQKNASGKYNIIAAINFINKEKLQGTFVAYKNPNLSFVSFFLGSRVKQISSFNNKLNSQDKMFLAKRKE